MAKVSKGAELRAEQAIAAAIAQAERCVALDDADGKVAQKDLLSVLEAADASLAKRLLKITPKPNGDMRFSAAQAIAYQAQIKIVIAHVQQKLTPIADEVGQAAIAKSLSSGAKLLAKLEQEFKGVSTSPSLLASMQQSQVARGPRASLVTRVATSVDRYGLVMGAQFSRIVQVGLAAGASTEEMVAALVAHGGPKGVVSLKAKEVAPGIVKRIQVGDIPEGLFVRHRYWAERIIRTETAYAYSGAKLAQLRELKSGGLEVQKKIVAHFDNRTAPDSVAVHGQIRELDGEFIDGAGRVYLHPPARPNDRETIIPWFDDWKETPSSQPPTAEEQAEATELAQPPPPNAAPVVPRSTEELHQMEQELRQLHADPQAAHRERAALELEHAAEASHQAETLAAKVLEKMRAEKLAAQKTLADALEKQKQEEAAKAAAQKKKEQAAVQKAHNAIAQVVKAGDPHLATLDLYELAGTKPKVFAQLVNKHREIALPEETIVQVAKGGGPEMADMLQVFVRETMQSGFAKYIDVETGPIADELLTFKKHAESFQPWIDSLAAKGDPVSKRKLAALFYSEGRSWAVSTGIAKQQKLIQATVTSIKKKYAPPDAPPKPKYTVEPSKKPGGEGYFDVKDPNGVTLAYFKGSGGTYTVTPPPGLGMSVLSTAVQADAAEYALSVSKAIQSKPVQPQIVAKSPVAKAKVNKYNRQPQQTTTTVLGPLKVGPKAKKQIAALQKKAAAHFAKHGVKLRGGYSYDGDERDLAGVDQVLHAEGYIRQQDKWSGEMHGCWYGSSTGPKSHAGLFVAKDERSAKDAKDGLPADVGGTHFDRFKGGMVDQVDPGGDPQKYFDHCRVKYAATQAALEHRRAAGELQGTQGENGDRRGEVDKDGYVVLYRGINGVQAAALRNQREEGKTTKVVLRSVSSWSASREAARVFSGEEGVIVRARVHISRIYSQYEQERIAYRRFRNEQEWIVMAEDLHHVVDSNDIENPGME